MKKIFKTRKSCRLCNSKKIVKVLDLPPIFPGEQLKQNINDKAYKVPIDIYQCLNCWHVQIINIPSKELMWNSEYTFMPSQNQKIIEHFEKTINVFKKKFKPKINNAFEVGSNDGLFLKLLKDKFKCDVLGIDPSRIPANEAKKNKIKTIVDFFSHKKSNEIKKRFNKFDVIIANNVYAHMDNLNDFTKGIKNLLKNEGFFIFEISYLPDVIKKKLIGTIIHEHLSIHSLVSLTKFFKKFNFQLIDIRHDDEVQGGALIGYVIHSKKKFHKSPQLKQFLNKEKKLKLNNSAGMRKFSKDFYNTIEKLKKKISRNFKKNEKFTAFGAARSAPIILKLLNLEKRVKYIVDNNKYKDQKYMPLENIQIKHENKHNFNLNHNYIITGWAQNDKIEKIIKLKKSRKQKIITIFPKFDVKKI